MRIHRQNGLTEPPAGREDHTTDTQARRPRWRWRRRNRGPGEPAPGPDTSADQAARVQATPAETLAAAERVQPDGEPGSSWLIVQKNRVTNGTGEGALTGLTGWSVVGTGEAGERGAPVGGKRSAGNVDRRGVATA